MKILPDDYLSRHRQLKPVKKIQHPSLGQLTWLFLPCFIALGIGIITHSYPAWIFWVQIISVLSFAGAATYFCIKQKCYKQLFGAYVIVLMFIGFLVAQNYTKRIFNAKDEQFQKEMPVKALEGQMSAVKHTPTNRTE